MVSVTTVTTVTTCTIPRRLSRLSLSWPFIGHAVSAANQRAFACKCRFEGMGSEIPIKYASQVNCESNLFDVAYLALGE